MIFCLGVVCMYLTKMFVFLFQAMVSVQMLSELEEIIQFKLVPERREAIKRTWWNRLQVRRRFFYFQSSFTLYIPF